MHLLAFQDLATPCEQIPIPIGAAGGLRKLFDGLFNDQSIAVADHVPVLFDVSRCFDGLSIRDGNASTPVVMLPSLFNNARSVVVPQVITACCEYLA